VEKIPFKYTANKTEVARIAGTRIRMEIIKDIRKIQATKIIITLRGLEILTTQETMINLKIQTKEKLIISQTEEMNTITATIIKKSTKQIITIKMTTEKKKGLILKSLKILIAKEEIKGLGQGLTPKPNIHKKNIIKIIIIIDIKIEIIADPPHPHSLLMGTRKKDIMMNLIILEKKTMITKIIIILKENEKKFCWGVDILFLTENTGGKKKKKNLYYFIVF
jgi:hypothetical protein